MAGRTDRDRDDHGGRLAGEPVSRIILDELDQDSARALGVEERHEPPMGTGPRMLIDEFDAGLGEASECGREIRNSVGEVVQTRASPGKETADGRVGAVRLEQLEPALAPADEDDIHALGVHTFACGTFAAGHEFEDREGFVDRSHGNSNVIERKSHHRPRSASFLQTALSFGK